MKIVVLVKEVPDTYGERKLDLETGLADRTASEPVPDEICERALEAALTFAEANPGTEITVLSAGPASVPTTLRKGLAVGATSAVHVLDEGMRGADLTLTAEVLAAAIRKTGFDLVIAGNRSTDGSGGVIPAMLAELLKVPHATNLTRLEIGAAEVTGTRAGDRGTQEVSAALPAVVSVTEALPDARMPNFKGLMAAKKKPFETYTLADLDVEADDLSVGRSIMISVAERPARQAGVKIIDEGDAAERLAEFLLQNRLA